jgi:hypothetical protein
MSSELSYGKKKMNAFKSSIEAYTFSKADYQNELRSFEQILDGIRQNHMNAMSTNNVDIQNDSYHTNYVLTAEGVVMKKEGSSSSTLSTNEFDENKNFVSSQEFKGESIFSNRFVQLGINDLKYDSSSSTLDTYKIANDIQITNEGNCSLKNVQQCDSFAKMSNDPYYGIEETSSACNCYTFQTKPSGQVEDNENIVTNTMTENGKSFNVLTNNSENEDDKYVILYNIMEDKYKVGKNISHVGFIGYNGEYHEIENKGENKNAVLKYVENVCGTLSNIGHEISNNESCIDDSTCIGVLSNEEKQYVINDENKKYMYPCEDGPYRYHHKLKGPSSPKDGCNHDVSYTTLIDYATYASLSKSNTSFDQLDQCGIQSLLKQHEDSLKKKRDTFEDNFSNMMNTFNALNEHELKLLKESGIKVHELKQMVNEYNNLHEKAGKIKENKDVFDIQKEDSKTLYQKTEYETAIIALVAIVAAIAFFNMKK